MMFVTIGKQYSRYIGQSCEIACFFCFLRLADITQWLQMTPPTNNTVNNGKYSIRYLGALSMAQITGKCTDIT